MLELKRIRENRAAVEEGLKKLGKSYNLDRLLAADDERKALLSEVEGLKAQRNKVSKESPMLKKNGEDTT